MKKDNPEETPNEGENGKEPVTLHSLTRPPQAEAETIEETFEFSSVASQMLDDLAVHFGGIDRCSAVCVAIALAFNEMVGGDE